MFTDEQIKRYSRHIILPEVGGKGQEKLLKARVLLIGAGGLGSPAALYLAAAGIGNLGIVDFDRVDESNLQRQILHSTADLNRSKAESAQEKLEKLNPDVSVKIFKEKISSQNALKIIQEYDYILDGSDNFPTRYLVNDACVMLNKTNIHGSIFRFEGQLTVLKPKTGPCYRCIYPDPPPAGAVPSCQQAGVLGVLPGIIGSLQAMETIKLILKIGKPLIGRLLCYNALTVEFKTFQLKPAPDCPVCSDNPTLTTLIDYEEFCGR